MVVGAERTPQGRGRAPRFGKWAVHLSSIFPGGVRQRADSSQASLRRPKVTAYRCFLPDLTGFTALRRAGPNSQHQLPGAVAP